MSLCLVEMVSLLHHLVSRGNKEGEFDSPFGICVDCDGFVYVCDYGNNRVQVF